MVFLRVNSQTRFGNTFNTGDNLLFISTVFQADADNILFAVSNNFEIFNETFGFQDFSNSQLNLAAGDFNFIIRIRVSISAIGSVITILKYPPSLLSVLPACFGYARNSSFISIFTEADTAEAKFTHIAMRSAANFAAVIMTNFEFRFAFPFFDQGFFSQCVPSSLMRRTAFRGV